MTARVMQAESAAAIPRLAARADQVPELPGPLAQLAAALSALAARVDRLDQLLVTHPDQMDPERRMGALEQARLFVAAAGGLSVSLDEKIAAELRVARYLTGEAYERAADRGPAPGWA